MTARLSETYRSGDLVQIVFNGDDGERWLAGRVAGFQHPGLWVQLASGSIWFVTNTRRIRPAAATGPESD